MHYANRVWKCTGRPDATTCPMPESSMPSTAHSWWVDLDPDADPPKVLAIAPTSSGTS